MCHSDSVLLPLLSQMVALLALRPSSDRRIVSAITRSVSLNDGFCINIVVFSNINILPDLCIASAFMVMILVSDASRSQIWWSINFKWSGVMLLALMLTEYGLTNVVAIIPIRAAPIKNGRDDWYGDMPALDTMIPSLDLVRLYDASNVPINTANGKNRGTYSNKRTQDS